MVHGTDGRVRTLPFSSLLQDRRNTSRLIWYYHGHDAEVKGGCGWLIVVLPHAHASLSWPYTAILPGCLLLGGLSF
jgi:hypothetical protein